MLIVSDLINNGIEIIESLKKRNKDFSKEIIQMHNMNQNTKPKKSQKTLSKFRNN